MNSEMIITIHFKVLVSNKDSVNVSKISVAN